MSQTENLSLRYNQLANRLAKNSKPVIRVAHSQLGSSKLFSLDASANRSTNFIVRNKDQSLSQQKTSSTVKTHNSRKTHSVVSRKKTIALTKKNTGKKNSTKNHSRLESQTTVTIKNQPASTVQLSILYDRLHKVLERHREREEEWKQQKEHYQLTISQLLYKAGKGKKH